MQLSRFSLLLFALQPAASQQIWDIWQTTWDRSGLFTSLAPSTPINFASPGAIGSADISVDDTQVFQNMFGFGGTLTDSAALLLNNLKNSNPSNYQTLLNYLFSPTDGANAAGLNYIRVPLGATDFSATAYTYDTSAGDTSFSKFNINNAPSYVFSILKDIKAVNQYIKIHVLPWSPPGWMKDSGTMNGGSLTSSSVSIYANYLLKSLQGFQSQGLTPYAISIQNEPQNSDSTYPSCTMAVAVEAQIGIALRTLMNNNGFSSVKLIGFDHNWSGVSSYAVPLLNAAPNAFAGVAFHCYQGTVNEQLVFQQTFPNKESVRVHWAATGGVISRYADSVILARVIRWNDDNAEQWYMDNIFIGAVQYGASAGLMWNIALDGNGQPMLPGTDSCGGGCRGIVQINSGGSWSVNQEFYAMAQASKAVIPKDVGGPFGQRIGATVGGSLSWALIVAAYVTGRVNLSDWLRYSIVVLNSDDNVNGDWDPTPVATTIEFRGMQARYTFPVGVTTLWWFAPGTSLNATNDQDNSYVLYSETDGQQHPLQFFH
ncbi:hypothetical protein D9757_003254 [Collybiopsis confluens]|uniref:Glycosyl hydrolase family 30 TIM-barrel domain-containing protein n=1 Tax=Collybiopsis confluens TaxID=2823264 RepID=A0A8H5HYM8_9AGAR|nr:hypothetical protein D9757_003254 [Collybiopsis confluens]